MGMLTSSQEDPLPCGLWRQSQRSPSRSSRCPHCGTAAPEHQFSSTGLPATLKAGQTCWSKDNFASFKLNLVSQPFSRLVESKQSSPFFLISLPCLCCRTKRTEEKKKTTQQLDFILGLLFRVSFSTQHKTNKSAWVLLYILCTAPTPSPSGQ